MSRWDQCVSNTDDQAKIFISDYFGQSDRKVLVIAGAGFDPRSAVVSELIASVAKQRSAIYIREERPDAAPELIASAEVNVARLAQLMPGCLVCKIPIFDGVDQAVVGPKRLARELASLLPKFTGLTDIVLDLSALSIGISFPLVSFIFGNFGSKPNPNIHIFVTEDIDLDVTIKPEHVDQPMYVHGFGGGASLDAKAKAVRLWIPQLVLQRREALRKIHDFVNAEETCPILPFPSRNLRRGDGLLEHFINEVVNIWEVDPRNYIYAAEREPIDLYRTLLRLDDARRKVYEAHGGSLLVLSPIGSKVLALGSLLAALERDLPVAYLESISYSFPTTAGNQTNAEWPLVHIWLSGDAYA